METQPPRQHPLVIQLRRYAQVFGEFEGPLLEAARRIHTISTTSDALMRERIQEAIRLGCNAKPDIIDETELDDFSVARIYQELLEDGHYEERPITGVNKSGSQKRAPGIFLKIDPAGNAGDLPRRLTRIESLSRYESGADEDDDEL